MVAISVLICCANAESSLEAACRSAGWADELVVVDSGSTDATEAIARRYADKYVVEPWRGYREQKLWGLSQCSHEWVFVLDGDEEISEALAGEIRALSAKALDGLDVLHMPRRNYLLGRVVRAWSPDRQSRLIHRERAQWPAHTLHEDRVPSSPERQARLKHPIFHKRVGENDFSDYFSGKRLDERLPLLVRHLHEKGKRATAADIFFRPIFAFLKLYFLKRGFLDGTFGLLIAQKTALGVQLKYAALWASDHGTAVGEARGESAAEGSGGGEKG